jgi:hypothetical protein
MPTYADACSHLQTRTTQRMLTYADVCRRIRRRMLTYADVCRRMLSPADAHDTAHAFEMWVDSYADV